MKLHYDCRCDFDDEQMKTFYGIGIPVIVFFQLLNILGIINIVRFCRLKGFTIIEMGRSWNGTLEKRNKSLKL